MTDLFKIQFKKPSLSSEETKKEEKKTLLDTKIEALYSRLETVEILIANGKVEDASIIICLLGLDVINLSLAFFEKPNTSFGKDWKSEIEAIKNDQLTEIYKKFDPIFSLSKNQINKSEDLLDEMASTLSGLISSLSKFYARIKKAELSTPLSDQMFTWKVQASSLALILFMILGSIVYRRVKYPDLAKTDVKIYFLSKSEPGPKEENAIANKIVLEKKGEWVEYDFILPKVTDVIEVRIDPIEQAKVRLTAESLKFFDSKGKLIYTHEFVWAEDLLPKDKLNYGAISELKMTARAVPGASIEMESTGSDPFFHIKFPEIKGAAKAQLKIRHIEAYKKFK